MAVALERVKMPELQPEVRVKSYDEAILGYTRKLAVAEAGAQGLGGCLHKRKVRGNTNHHRMERLASRFSRKRRRFVTN